MNVKKCEYCGKEFFRGKWVSIPRFGKRRFCSVKCSITTNANFTKWAESARAIARKRVSEPFLMEGEMVCTVRCHGEQFTFINASDADIVGVRTWAVSSDGYAYCPQSRYKNGQVGPQKKIRLQRLIMDFPEGLVVDHVNGNTLDNRRCNLRAVTNSQNGQNRKGLDKNNTTGARGVSFTARNGKYAVQVKVEGKSHWLGYFADFNEAKTVASEARKRLMTHARECKS